MRKTKEAKARRTRGTREGAEKKLVKKPVEKRRGRRERGGVEVRIGQ